jgi:hypothetical protein
MTHDLDSRPLDDTTLDIVAGTLENLASSGSQMVGVITTSRRWPNEYRFGSRSPVTAPARTLSVSRFSYFDLKNLRLC